MKTNFSFALSAFLLIYSAMCSTLYADQPKPLHFTVRDSNHGIAIKGAQIHLYDSAGARITSLTTNKEGEITFAHGGATIRTVEVSAEGFLRYREIFNFSSSDNVPIEIRLEPTITALSITGASRDRLLPNERTVSSRGRDFASLYPVQASNPQQITGLLLSVPGIVQDSANQFHARGEHSASTMYLSGYQLGGAAQGRFGPVINPDALESLDVVTGAMPAEYAGGAAIIDSTIRSGSSGSLSKLELGGGSYETGTLSFSLAGQADPRPNTLGQSAEKKIFSYFLTGQSRSTDIALEAPQPRAQSSHNHGSSQSILGRFDITPSYDDQFSLITSFSPAQTQIANRTGLPESFAPFGQGYGFGGALSAKEAEEHGITSQDVAGQDIFQKDENNFSFVQWRHDSSPSLRTLISLGMNDSQLDTGNNNPLVNLADLPEDNSIEYNPSVLRRAGQKQLSASISKEAGLHTIKGGVQFNNQSARDSYQLTPASQLAVNALYASDPRLLPSGSGLIDQFGEPLLDKNGNQIYSIDPNAKVPQLFVRSTGYYRAAYLQDTWNAFTGAALNIGVRYDTYRQEQNLSGRTVSADQFSPRVNFSYLFLPEWTARVSFNRMFIEPPLSQGSLIGEPIKPEKVSQYETGIERQFSPRHKVKVNYYVKRITDQVDTGLLIPGTQLGVYTSVNLDKAAVHGTEFTYELSNEHGFGSSAFLSYAYATAKPSGFDNTGEAVDAFNDHDQRHTLSAGAAYTFSTRAVTSINLLYGSGVESSRLSEDQARNSRASLNVSITSPPKILLGRGGLRFTATNLFDDRSVVNFNSAFSGTRFQQPQTFMLSAFFDF